MSLEHIKMSLEHSTPVECVPFKLFINNTYWHKVADVKLEKDKTEEVVHPIWGYYTSPSKVPKLVVDYASFNKDSEKYMGQSIIGYQVNKNSIESFEDEDIAKSVINDIGSLLFRKMKSGELSKDLRHLTPFILYTYSDLKKFIFHYRIYYVTLEGDYFYHCCKPENINKVLFENQVSQLKITHKSLPMEQKLMYFIEVNDEVSVITVEQFLADYNEEYVSSDKLFMCFSDPVFEDHNPGWILQNALFFLLIRCPKLFDKLLNVIAIRGGNDNNPVYCLVYAIGKSNKLFPEVPTFISCDSSDNKGVVDLSSSMDPLMLSKKLTDLNLQLMKWNLEPNFQLIDIQETSCLLLGAGTLGCAVSRNLISWGIKTITFVDSGTVSYSNPVRQSLYTFEDSVQKLDKADAAADALKKIHPHVDAIGEKFMIPMLGHGDLDMECVERLDCLIKSHDVIFLLTDSREARWLPTVFSSIHEKITITVALGFDTYLVIRHGVSNQENEEKLGCYFCSDVMAPGNSILGRTLDQQCTISRAGLSNIASALAVELVISLLHHPAKGNAQHNSVSCFGKIPHSIRGFLREFEQIYPTFPSYEKCIACSRHVLSHFDENGAEFLATVFDKPSYLEDITGITEMKSCTKDDQMLELDDSDSG